VLALAGRLGASAGGVFCWRYQPALDPWAQLTTTWLGPTHPMHTLEAAWQCSIIKGAVS
jgi:hypothetical protein